MARVRVGRVADLGDGDLHAVKAGGTALIVGLSGTRICAARDHCPHLGLPLSRGPGGQRLADGEVICPWHNSRFDLATGENRDWATGFAGRAMPRWSHRALKLGRSPAPLETYPVDVEGDDVYAEI